MTSAGKSRKFFFVLAALSLVFSSAGYTQVYEITEQELQQIEANLETIAQEAQQWKTQAELLEKRAQKLKEQQESLETAREELNQQLQEQARLYAKSESEKRALIKYGIPAAALCIAGAFFAGYFASK